MPLSLPHLLAIGAAISLALSACGGSAGEASGDASASDAPAAGSSTTEAMAEDEMEDEVMVEDEVAMPSWQTLEITDVNGATFTLADFVGTPVFVEAFGNSSINPPSTPHFVIDAMGHAGELVTGFEEPIAARRCGRSSTSLRPSVSASPSAVSTTLWIGSHLSG